MFIKNGDGKVLSVVQAEKDEESRKKIAEKNKSSKKNENDDSEKSGS